MSTHYFTKTVGLLDLPVLDGSQAVRGLEYMGKPSAGLCLGESADDAGAITEEAPYAHAVGFGKQGGKSPQQFLFFCEK